MFLKGKQKPLGDIFQKPPKEVFFSPIIHNPLTVGQIWDGLQLSLWRKLHGISNTGITDCFSIFATKNGRPKGF